MPRLFSLILVALVFFNCPYAAASSVQDKAFSLIMDTINQQIQGKLDAQSLEFSPPSTVLLSEVKLFSRSGKKLLSAKSIKATITLSDLFLGKLNFEELIIDAPIADFQIIDGSLDLLSIFGGESAGKGPTVGFGHITVRNAQIFISSAENVFRLQNAFVESGAFDSDFKTVPLKRISGDFSASSIDGSVSLDGALTIANASKTTQFDYQGSLPSLRIKETKLSQAKLSTTLVLSNETLSAKRVSLTSSLVTLEAVGSWMLKNDLLDLSFDSQLRDARLFFPTLDPNTLAKDIHARGTLKGPVTNLILGADVDGKWQSARLIGDISLDIKAEQLRGSLKAKSTSELDLKALTGMEVSLRGADARVQFNGNFKVLKTEIDANLLGAQASNPQFSGTGISLKGESTLSLENPAIDGEFTVKLQEATLSEVAIVNAIVKAKLRGPIQNISAQGTLTADGFGPPNLPKLRINTDFEFGNKSLNLKNALLNADKGEVRINGFSFNTSEQTFRGEGLVENFDLVSAFFKEIPNSTAFLDGSFSIDGNARDPRVNLHGVIRNLTLYGEVLGDVDVIGTLGEGGPQVLQLSAAVRSDKGSADLQVALDTLSRQVNALVDFKEIGFDKVLDNLKPWLQFGPSNLSGQLEVHGSLTNPDATLAVVLNADRADEQMNLLAMNIGATLSNHQFSFGGCANVHKHYREDEPCLPSVPIKIKGEGTLRSLDDFSVKYNAKIESESFERVSDLLRKESIQLDINTQIEGDFEKKPGKETRHEVTVSLSELLATLPDEQPIRLEKPTIFKWAQNRIVVEPDAHFLLSDGEFTLGGQFSSEKIAAQFDGRIPLYLARLFNRNIVTASGIAAGNIVLSGDFQKPSIRGVITPEKGSFIRFRSLPSNIEFESGEVRADLVTQEQLIRLDVDNLRMRLGNGVVSLNGQMDFDHLTTEPDNVLRKADVSIIASDISTIMRDFAIEGDVSLSLKTEAQAHWIRGWAKVGAGKIARDFKLDGFEINAVNTPTSEFVWPQFFNRFKTQIDLDLSPFDISADFGPFEFSGSISGNDLKIAGDLPRMRVFGNLTLVGALKFPVVDFEIPTTQVPLRDTPGMMVDPEIDIKASAELGKDFGLTQDASVELSLKGSADHLHLDLVPSSGEKLLDRQKILGVLLNIDLGPSLLLRPLFAKVEDVLKSVTKTRIRIGQIIDDEGFSTKISWRLNSRLEISGSTSTKQLGLGDVRFRLKMFDHLPIGKDLSLEGIFSFSNEEDKGQQNLQLNYRLFEK